MLRKILRIIFKILLGLVVFVALYLGAEYCLSSITIDKEKSEKVTLSIYIKTNGVHTDIVVPVKNELIDWSKEIKLENVKMPDTNYRYLGLGWGDKGFYLETPNWSDLKFSVAFNAAFGLSTTAIHATFYKNLIEDKSCKKINISAAQYLRLINYISSSFQKDKHGHFMVINTNANYGDNDVFYEANGSYSMLHTCNTWSNTALKKCGQKACLWTAFDKGIFKKYED